MARRKLKHKALESYVGLLHGFENLADCGNENRHQVIRTREENTTRVSSHKIYMEFKDGFTFDPASPIEIVRDEVDTAYTLRAFSEILREFLTCILP